MPQYLSSLYMNSAIIHLRLVSQHTSPTFDRSCRIAHAQSNNELKNLSRKTLSTITRLSSLFQGRQFFVSSVIAISLFATGYGQSALALKVLSYHAPFSSIFFVEILTSKFWLLLIVTNIAFWHQRHIIRRTLYLYTE